ncbi:unnamed protein product, partial [Larinioides sclopetarius]
MRQKMFLYAATKSTVEGYILMWKVLQYFQDADSKVLLQ